MSLFFIYIHLSLLYSINILFHLWLFIKCFKIYFCGYFSDTASLVFSCHSGSEQHGPSTVHCGSWLRTSASSLFHVIIYVAPKYDINWYAYYNPRFLECWVLKNVNERSEQFYLHIVLTSIFFSFVYHCLVFHVGLPANNDLSTALFNHM